MKKDNISYLKAPLPLFFVALSVIAGIIAARYIHIPFIVFTIFWCGCVILYGILLLLPKTGIVLPHHRKHMMVFLYIGFFALGGMRYEFHYHFYPREHIIGCCPPDQPRLATLRGVIISKPQIRQTLGAMQDYDFMHEPATVFDLDCREVLTVNPEKEEPQWRPVRGRCRAIVREPMLNLQQGDSIELLCWIGRRGRVSNPGQFNQTDYFHAGRNLVYAAVDSCEGITFLPDTHRHSIFTTCRQKLQEQAASLLTGPAAPDASSPAAQAGVALMDALMLGQRGELSREFYDTFLRTGTAHFLSVSGFHVGLVVGLVWWVGWLLRLPRRSHALFCLGITILYMMLIPSRPPILRAGILAIVFCLAAMGRRQRNPLNLTAFAALLIVLWRPMDVFNAGFQLSFVVVLGLITLSPAVFLGRFSRRALIDEIDREIIASHQPQSVRRQLFEKCRLTLWGLFTVSLVAWIVSLPLSAVHFNRIAPWGILGSVIMFPLVSLSMFTGLLTMAFAPLLPTLAAGFAGLSNIGCRLIISCNNALAGLPFSSIHTAVPPWWLIVFHYLMLLVILWSIRQKGRIGRLPLYGFLLSMIVFVSLLPVRLWHKGELKVHILDIGHGSCSVTELPDGKVILYDIGSLSDYDLAWRTVIPFLRSRGIQQLDAVFISHANLDHYNGLVDLCRGFLVRRIYTTPSWRQQIGSSERFVQRACNAMNQTIDFTKRGDRLITDHKLDYGLEVLWPPANLPIEIEANDTSLVLRITCANQTVLLCGDIEEAPQRWLIEHELPERLRANAILLPHHGAPVPSLADFVTVIQPKLALNSSGRLSDKKLDQLEQLLPDTPIYHTFENGCLTITCGQKTPMQIKTYLKY